MEVVPSDGDHTSRRSCVSVEKGVFGGSVSRMYYQTDNDVVASELRLFLDFTSLEVYSIDVFIYSSFFSFFKYITVLL